MSVQVFPGNVPETIVCGGGTVTNGGPGTVYYATSQNVTTANADGSLAAGASVALEGVQFFIAAVSRATLNVAAPLTSTVVSTASVLVGVTGRNYKVVSGVLRNAGASAYFQPIDDGSTHRPQNIDTVTTSAGATGLITVNYPTIAVTRVVAFLAEPDEVYTAAGITLGCSVGTDHTDISCYRTRNFSDEIHYDGAAWVRSSGSTYSPFLVASFTSGVLRLTHADIGVNNPYAVSLTPAGTTYRTVINGTVSATEINLSFVDSSGNVVTTADTNMKVHVARPQFQPIQISPQSLATSSFPNSNIWLLGVFEV